MPGRIGETVIEARKIIDRMEDNENRKAKTEALTDIDDYIDDYDIDNSYLEEKAAPSEEEDVDELFSNKDRKISQREKQESASLTYISLRTGRLKRIQNKYDQANRDSMMGMMNFKPYGFSGEEESDDEQEDASEETEDAVKDVTKESIENIASEPLISRKARLSPEERFSAIQAIHNTSTANFFQW